MRYGNAQAVKPARCRRWRTPAGLARPRFVP